MLIPYKKPRPQHYTSDDYSVYKAIVAQTRVRAYPNKSAGSARPCSTWKWKHMLRGMAIPGDMLEEEEGDTEGASFQTVVGHHHLISCPRLTSHPLVSLEKTRKKRKTREAFSKGY